MPSRPAAWFTQTRALILAFGLLFCGAVVFAIVGSAAATKRIEERRVAAAQLATEKEWSEMRAQSAAAEEQRDLEKMKAELLEVEKEEARKRAAVTVRVSATKLARVYAENQIAAQENYEGRTLHVTGTVSKVLTHDTGLPIVLLEASPTPVRCVLPLGQKSLAASLESGQELECIGRGLGDELGAVVYVGR